jgi:LPS sulfotransferase NodH
MKETIKGRIFLVGCPRSGTTLLQSLIAAHPQVASFPETHFFFAIGRKWYHKLGIASRTGAERKRLYQFLDKMDQTAMKQLVPRYSILRKPYIDAFVEILDRLAINQGKPFWLEKTPGHLHYVEFIEKYISNVKFIHILRNGPDVVASLYEIANQYPDEWYYSFDIDQCIARWNGDTKITRQNMHKENHIAVRYEKLVENTEAVLAEVCEFIGVTFRQDMIARHSLTAESLILKDETWKQAVTQEIRNTNTKKFHRVFSEQEREYILGRLVNLDHDTLL